MNNNDYDREIVEDFISELYTVKNSNSRKRIL